MITTMKKQDLIFIALLITVAPVCFGVYTLIEYTMHQAVALITTIMVIVSYIYTGCTIFENNSK